MWGHTDFTVDTAQLSCKGCTLAQDYKTESSGKTVQIKQVQLREKRGMFESEMVVNRRVGNIFELFSRSIIRAQQAAPDDRNEDLARSWPQRSHHHSSQVNSPCGLQHDTTESAFHDQRTRSQWFLYFLRLCWNITSSPLSKSALGWLILGP